MSLENEMKITTLRKEAALEISPEELVVVPDRQVALSQPVNSQTKKIEYKGEDNPLNDNASATLLSNPIHL